MEMNMEQSIQQIQKWVAESKRIVFFGGAGVSTESGIPDFRSAQGVFNQEAPYPPETIVSRPFFDAKPEVFFNFYREKMLFLDSQPNITHEVLARWEREGKEVTIVTQNIDGLHQAAGSGDVIELHGSVHRNYCRRCKMAYDAKFIKESAGIPKCTRVVNPKRDPNTTPERVCGGIIKPDVVLYKEGLDEYALDYAVEAIHNADMIIIAGTSLNVQPAAGLLRYYRGKKMVLINRSETPADSCVDLLIHAKLGEVFSQL